MTAISQLVSKQKQFFQTNKTLDVKWRKANLIKLKNEIIKKESLIYEALKKDLNKSEFESYACEVAMVITELSHMIKHIDKYSKRQYVKTPVVHFYSRSYIYQNPFGNVLIISPWNYPFMLSISPLIGAIAAGNTCILKPSAYSENTSNAIKEILNIFEDEYIAVVTGGREENKALLDEKFDFIFFTGSSTVGKLVAQKASNNLTPYILELGGKSPCFVTKDAKLDLAAKRIAWGKTLNSGQTCVAPDYILVEESVKDELIKGLEKYIAKFVTKNSENNSEYTKIVNKNHFNRLCDLIKEEGLVPQCNETTNQIAPIIIANATFDSPCMREELFGPIIPIISYKNIEEAFEKVNSLPRPLASYLFTSSKAVEAKFTSSLYFGGGCINDTIIHLANPEIPFNGVGNSGMGRYHGKDSYFSFSSPKSILKKSTLFDINIRYAPAGNKLKLLKFMFKYFGNFNLK